MPDRAEDVPGDNRAIHHANAQAVSLALEQKFIVARGQIAQFDLPVLDGN